MLNNAKTQRILAVQILIWLIKFYLILTQRQNEDLFCIVLCCKCYQRTKKTVLHIILIVLSLGYFCFQSIEAIPNHTLHAK